LRGFPPSPSPRAGEKAFFLFLGRNVKKEFSNNDAVSAEVTFDISNVFEPIFPDIFVDEL
jgi:hypothetical protein